MSPAHSHVDQSRNTLLFASCAKDVSTNAQVNVVISDKALVKQLQQELARLANELKLPPGSNDSASTYKRDGASNRKGQEFETSMGKEIEELTQQRDRAESRLDYLIRVTGTDPNSLPWVGFFFHRVNAIFVPKVWPVLRLSYKGLFFHIWIQKV
ncbi:putative kinesin-like protein [Helianthus annuus]|nr:putative kinesin-like protein [Helianthus annuus]